MGLREQILDKYAAMSDEILNRLRKSQAKAIEALPKEIEDAAGFAMIVSSKGALGISVESGDGFVVANLGKLADGKVKFSAPLFIQLKKLGVGLQLGYTQLYTIIIFATKEQLEAFKKRDVVLGQDIYLNQDPTLAPPTDIGAVNETNLISNNSTLKAAKVVSVADGVVGELSVNGGCIAPNGEVNELVYNCMRDPVSILNGDAPVPVQFLNVYDDVQGK